MYAVAWVIVAAIFVVAGIVLVLGITAASPLFGLLALVIGAIFALMYFIGRRGQIGTERQRAARGRTAGSQSGSGEPASGEGSRPSSGRDYEPAL